MEKIKYSPKQMFKVVDQEALREHINSLFDPAVFYDSWGEHKVPTYIIIDKLDDTYEIDPEHSSYGEDPAIDEENFSDKYNSYKAFDVHQNGDVSKICSWEEYRLDYLLEEDIIEKAGYYPYLEELRELKEENNFFFDILREENIQHPREL